MLSQSRNKWKKDSAVLVEQAMHERYLLECGNFEELTFYVDSLKEAEKATDEMGIYVDWLGGDPIVERWVRQKWGEEL